MDKGSAKYSEPVWAVETDIAPRDGISFFQAALFYAGAALAVVVVGVIVLLVFSLEKKPEPQILSYTVKQSSGPYEPFPLPLTHPVEGQ